MKQKEFTIISEADRLEISCLAIEPDTEPKAVVMLAHGIMEYKERFIPLMSFFAENGYACVINDHRGYGKSVKSEEDNGYTYGQGAKGTLTDMRSLFLIIKREYPGKKVFLYGHSMGALCAVCYTKRWGKELSGVILSALPEYVSAVGIGVKYLKVKKLFKGDRFRDEAVNKLMFDSYSSKFKGATSKYCWINSDEEKVKEYEADPGCGQLGTIDGYLSLLELLQDAYDKKNWADLTGLMPVFIAAGEDDVCAGGEKGIAAGEKYLRSIGLVRTEHKAYHKMRHEIHNEPEHELVYRDYLDRLEAWM